MEKISWISHLRSGEVIQRVQEKRNILQIIKRRKATWIGYVLSRKLAYKTRYWRKDGRNGGRKKR